MTVALLINDRRHVGWTEATVTRSLETISGAFTVTLSEREPGETTPRVIRPGNACRVELEDETVLQGWVDAVTVDYDAGAHTIAVRGRDATGDLVDCSAATKPGEWKNERLENIASALCEPFGISVSREIDTGAPFSRFRIEEGESVFEAIERACRFRAVLPLSDGKGGSGPRRPLAQPHLSAIGARRQHPVGERHGVMAGAVQRLHAARPAGGGGGRLYR